jgi:DNA-directed RNA polymerase specialized sigma24 family protein
VHDTRLKKDWSLTPAALRRLLDWLDQGADSKGQSYLEMRARLVVYFDRKNCVAPDELADETLNRVARRLEEEEAIETDAPAKYCYTTARFVFLEQLRSQARDRQWRLSVREGGDANANDAPSEIRERMLNCLDQCARQLEGENRDLILRYYFGAERVKIDNRRALARTLGITINALSIRACRIREKLERCVRSCLATEDETIS